MEDKQLKINSNFYINKRMIDKKMFLTMNIEGNNYSLINDITKEKAQEIIKFIKEFIDEA